MSGVTVLQVLPEGFALPPILYLVPLLLAVAGVTALIVAIRPPVTDWTVIAFAPWMMLGAVLHVLFQQGAFPDVLEPLFGTPTVYLTTYVFAGLAWVFSTLLAEMRRNASVDRQFGIFGGGFAAVFAGFSMYIGSQSGALTASSAFWPVIGVTVAGILAALAWVLLSLTFTDAVAVTGAAGALVVFAHSLDGVSTAIGIDVLGVSERTPLSQHIIDFGASLPTEPYLGTAWLFVFVKVVLALVIVAALEGEMRENPVMGRVLLGLVAAVGLGPGIHNLLLFAVS